MRTGKSYLAFLSACLIVCGCGQRPATVRGIVTVDGKPLDRGLIVFYAAGASAPAEIKDGRYELTTTSGAKIVQITAPIVVDKRKDAPDAPWTEFTAERLPARYHSASQLRFEAASGENVKDWELTTK